MEDGSSHQASRSRQSNSSNFLPLLGSSLACGAWPRGARRLPLAAPGRLAAGLSPLPSPAPRFAPSPVQPRSRGAACSAAWVAGSWPPGCLRLPACRCRQPSSPPGPGQAASPWSRLARARCAAAGCRPCPLGAPESPMRRCRCGDARYGWALAVASPLQFSELLLKKFWAAEPRAMARVARGVHPPLCALYVGTGPTCLYRSRCALFGHFQSTRMCLLPFSQHKDLDMCYILPNI